MKPHNPLSSHPPDEAWLEAHMEAYLDGELSNAERATFERGLEDASVWEADKFLARKIRQGLATLHDPYCPDKVTEAVLAETRRRTRASRLDRLHNWFERRWQAYWQPALAMTVLLLVVMSAVLLGQPPRHTIQSAEVEAAMAEVQWTLAYLSEVGRHTGQTVRQEVLEERIILPVHDAVSPLLTTSSSE